MQLGHLYGTFQGRISRKPFWWGTILLIVILSVAGAAAFVAIGPSFGPDFDVGDPGVRTFILAMQALSLLSLYPSTAIAVKRLHDRNRSGYFIAYLYGPMIIKAVTDLAGITGDADNIGPLDLLLGGIVLIVSIWFLVILGFLRGTPGPNRFGPDPLGGTAPAVAPGA